MLRQKIAVSYPFLYSHILNIIRIIIKRYGRKSCDMQAPPPFSDSHVKLPALPNKTIFFFIYWLKPSGAEFYALECAKIAKINGFKIVWVVDYQSDNQDWDELFLEVSSDVYRLWQVPLGDDPSQWIIELIKKYSPFAIHLHHSLFAYRNLNAIKALFPWIVTIDSTHIVEIKGEGFPRISSEVGNLLDYRNVISDGLKEYFLTHEINNNSILRTVIAPENNSKNIKLPINKNRIKIAIIGRLDEQKRPYLIKPFIDQLKQLMKGKRIDNNVVIDLFIYGAGEYYTVLADKIVGTSSSVSVQIISDCYDKDQLYQDVFCVIQLSENEGISLVSYEAILRNIFILCADVGQQSEVIEPVFLLPSNAKKTVQIAALKLVELINNPDKFSADFSRQHRIVIELDKKYGYKQVMNDFYSNLYDNQ